MRAPESFLRIPALAAVARNFSGAAVSCAAVLTGGALLLAGCSARDLPETRVQAFSPSSAQTLPATPMAVSCEPNQRAVVHPVLMNGVTVSQVDCVSTAFAPTAAPAMYEPAAASPVPVSYGNQYAAEPPRVVPATYSAPRVTETRRVTTTRSQRIEPQGRSWKKSALIIGSSAGVAAGVGGAVGGKKGALIGAAIGGGGATIWDQMTRRD